MHWASRPLLQRCPFGEGFCLWVLHPLRQWELKLWRRWEKRPDHLGRVGWRDLAGCEATAGCHEVGTCTGRHKSQVAAAAAAAASRCLHVHWRPFGANFSANERFEKLVKFIDFFHHPFRELCKTDAVASVGVNEVKRHLVFLCFQRTCAVCHVQRAAHQGWRVARTCLFRSFFGTRERTPFARGARCCRYP